MPTTRYNAVHLYYVCSFLSHHQVEEYKHVHRAFSKASLGPAASSNYARGLFSIPNLRSLELSDVELSEGFYSVMAAEASKSKVYPYTIFYRKLYLKKYFYIV